MATIFLASHLCRSLFMSSKSFGPLQIISNPPSSIHPSDCQENSWREMWFFFFFLEVPVADRLKGFFFIYSVAIVITMGPPAGAVIHLQWSFWILSHIALSRQSFLCLCALGKRIILCFFPVLQSLSYFLIKIIFCECYLSITYFLLFTVIAY